MHADSLATQAFMKLRIQACSADGPDQGQEKPQTKKKEDLKQCMYVILQSLSPP